MNSSKPYMIRALHQWINDNDCTPLILASSDHQDIQIPNGIDEDGKVVLNISHGATKNLEIINEGILFDARFAGKSEHLFVPINSVLAIYARENGQGMMFNEGPDDVPEPPDETKSIKDKQNNQSKSFLKVVK